MQNPCANKLNFFLRTFLFRNIKKIKEGELCLPFQFLTCVWAESVREEHFESFSKMDPNYYYNYFMQQQNYQPNVQIPPGMPGMPTPYNFQQSQQQNIMHPNFAPSNTASSAPSSSKAASASKACSAQRPEDVFSDSSEQKATQERWTKDQVRVL